MAALVLAAFAVPLLAAAEKPPLRMEDIFELEKAVDPQISPDGAQVAYVRITPDITTDDYRLTIWTVGADGAAPRQLTEPEEFASSPRWSPDGDRIAFVALREGAPHIVVRDVRDGAESLIGGLSSPAGNLSWSPDGKMLAFSMLVPAPARTLGHQMTPPEGATWKPGPKVIDRGLYRMDGLGYFPDGKVHLFVVPAEGGPMTQVTGPDSGSPPFVGRLYSWMPDSKALVVSLLNKTDDEIMHGALFDSGLYYFAIDGSESRKLVDRPGPESSPAVSPDGRYVAYTGFEDDGIRSYTVSSLNLLDLKTGETRVLTTGLDRDVEAPVWTPDGKGIYAYYTSRGLMKLARFSLDGKVTDLTDTLAMPLSAYSAAYTSDVGYTVTAKGKFAFQWGSATSSGNIAVLDLADGAPSPITGLNETLLASRATGALEEIDYVSSAGDLPIQGWVIYPPGFDPHKKYPLILEIHGGPNANYGPRFDIEKQLLAAAGYVVLYVNARGSTSYGGDFGNLIQDEFPGLEFEDFMSGVDAMLARGFIDESRLYVAGGSGGGTLSAQIVSKTDRFQAAAVLYPVLDWTVQALTADTMSLVFDGLFHDTPWSQPEAYQRRSLLATVPEVKTPVMTLTGENDYRTPMVQSEMYHAALKYNGVESVLVRMPMEGHGTRRYPSHFAAKVGAIIGWFDAHNPAVTSREESPD